MKRFLALFLCAVALLSCTGCSGLQKKEITCADVIAAYEKAGYGVFHKEESYAENGTCYVRIDDLKSDEYIYFEFFTDAKSAEAYAEQRQWNVALWLFSLIYSDPQWNVTKTYNNIEYEYRFGSDMINPFNELISDGWFSFLN